MDGSSIPKFLNQILSKNLRVKTSKQPFTVGKMFSYGSLLIPVQNQEMNSDEIFNYLNQIILNAFELQESKQDLRTV
jgi:hypothetical protein